MITKINKKHFPENTNLSYHFNNVNIVIVLAVLILRSKEATVIFFGLWHTWVVHVEGEVVNNKTKEQSAFK